MWIHKQNSWLDVIWKLIPLKAIKTLVSHWRQHSNLVHCWDPLVRLFRPVRLAAKKSTKVCSCFYSAEVDCIYYSRAFWPTTSSLQRMVDRLKEEISVHLADQKGEGIHTKMASRPRVNFETPSLPVYRERLMGSGTRTASFEGDGTLQWDFIIYFVLSYWLKNQLVMVILSVTSQFDLRWRVRSESWSAVRVSSLFTLRNWIPAVVGFSRESCTTYIYIKVLWCAFAFFSSCEMARVKSCSCDCIGKHNFVAVALINIIIFVSKFTSVVFLDSWNALFTFICSLLTFS